MDVSIGARLRAAREQRRLTIEEVSDATRVRAHYLEALESDDLSAMPSTAQARGFLKIYASFLGLGDDDLRPEARPQNEVNQAGTGESESGSAAAVSTNSRPSFLNRLRERVSRRPVPSVEPERHREASTRAAAVSSEDNQPESKKKALS